MIRNIEKEVIIVNDCSTDKTENVVQNYISNNSNLTINYFKYIKHDVNQGKGAAIHTGIAQATGDYLLVQDADLEYDPGEYNTLLKPIITRLGRCGIRLKIYGAAILTASCSSGISIGNRVLTFLSNMFSNLNLTDMETGLQVIPYRYYTAHIPA